MHVAMHQEPSLRGSLGLSPRICQLLEPTASGMTMQSCEASVAECWPARVQNAWLPMGAICVAAVNDMKNWLDFGSSALFHTPDWQGAHFEQETFTQPFGFEPHG